jgi:hypothetical protein
MSIWKTAMACSLTAAVLVGQIGQASAAPLPTNVATMKAAAGDDVTQVHWRGGGWGWGLGGLAAGAMIGAAIASSAPYGYYGGGPYYGYPGYGYGYAPAYYGYGYGAAYPRYYRPYRPYYGYRYGYYRPYHPYYRHYYRGYW